MSGTQSVFCRVSSVAGVVITECMRELRVWPHARKRKGKRRVERQPFAVTSGKYEDLFEKKLVERAAEEGEKQERKSKRKEAKM
jgi:hypothetical protein